jgi:plasmid replication initiation protein
MPKILNVEHKSKLSMGNRLVKGRYELSKQEQSLIYLLISQINKDDDDFKDYKITVSDLDKVSGVKHNKQRIKELVDTVMARLVRFIDSDGNKVTTHWFSAITALKGESALIVRFDKALKPCFFELQGHFTQAELPTLLGFKSKYASRLYLLLKSDYDFYRGDKKRFEYTVEELINMFQMPDSYKIYKNFKTDFLIKSINEINEKTAFNIEFEPHKSGRKITSIEFIISEIRNAIATESKPKDTIESLLTAHGIGKSKIDYMLTWSLDIGYIRKVVKYITRDDLGNIVTDMLMSNYDAMQSKKAVFISKCEAWIKDNYTEQQAIINLNDMAQHIEDAIKQGCIQI